MSELPVGDEHQVIRLGDQAAVVVPIEEYRRLREIERRAQLAEQADEFRRALEDGNVPEGTLVIKREDLDRWRNASPEEWEAGRLADA